MANGSGLIGQGSWLQTCPFAGGVLKCRVTFELNNEIYIIHRYVVWVVLVTRRSTKALHTTQYPSSGRGWLPGRSQISSPPTRHVQQIARYQTTSHKLPHFPSLAGFVSQGKVTCSELQEGVPDLLGVIYLLLDNSLCWPQGPKAEEWRTSNVQLDAFTCYRVNWFFGSIWITWSA